MSEHNVGASGQTESRRIWSRLWEQMRPNRRILVSGLLCAVGMSLTSLLTMALITDLLKAMEHHDQSRLTLVCLSVVGLYAARWFLNYGETVYFAEAGQRLGMRLRNVIYTHLQGLSLGFFNRQRTGALMSTINNDVPILQSTIASLKDIAPAPFLFLGGMGYIFWLNWKLALIALLVFPLMAATINRITRVIRQITGQTQDKLADVNILLEETLSGIRVIQS
nr:ABC transporter transmembrane domain-containing protein [Armatimonadota bacterium]